MPPAPTMPGQLFLEQSAFVFARPGPMDQTARNELQTTLQVHMHSYKYMYALMEKKIYVYRHTDISKNIQNIILIYNINKIK